MENAAEMGVKTVVIASAPEREEELLKMWDEHRPQINMIDDKPGFMLEAGSFGLVLFNHKTMCQIWLLGFAAQHAFNLYLPHLLLSEFTGYPFSLDEVAKEKEGVAINQKISDLLASINYLGSVESIDEFDWPDDVPQPDDGKPNDVNGSMVFDLLCMASAYCFLHELKHVQFRNTGEQLDPLTEEHECDKYARDFLFEKISAYSEKSGDDLGLLKNKRGMAIALASVLLLTLTPENRWSGSQTHPSIVSRIQELVNSISIGTNDYFWLYLTSLLLSQITHKGIFINPHVVKSQQDFCFMLLGAIDSHLSRLS